MTVPTRRTLSRRNVLTGTAAATAIAATSTLPTSLAAKAPLLGASQASTYRFKLGSFECTTIADGAIQLGGPHPIFGQNKSAEEVQKLAKENFLPPSKMEIAFTPLLVNTGTQLVLFDTGNGNLRRPNAGHLRKQLGAAGYTPEQVDIVVLTHFHPDHIAGLMEDGKPAYPNARYVTSEVEYNFWSPKEVAEGKLARVGKLVQSNVVPLAEKMTFLKDGGEVTSGIRAISAFGHTPGHTAYHIESGSSRLMLWADATNHYVASLQRPDWHVKFDMDKQAAADTRKKLLGMAAADRIPCTGYHMPFPAVGFVEASGSSYRWVPVAYQMQL